MREVFNRWLAIALLASLAISGTAYAGPYGYDLHNVLAPRSAGMAGTSIAKPLDNVSAIFGNPAALTDWTGTEFTFGATYYKPEVRLDHSGAFNLPTYAGSVPDAVFGEFAVPGHSKEGGTAIVCGNPNAFCIPDAAFDDAVNGNEGYIVPQVGVTQDLRPLGLPAVLGAGLTAVSGIGVEFRHVEETLGLGAEFIVLGANFSLGWELNERVSIGGAATITYAYLDLGLAATSGVTHDTGMRGTLGLTYEDILPGTRLGVFYMTELQHVFDDIIAVPPDDYAPAQGDAFEGYGDDAPVRYASIPIEEPRTIGIGISNETFMDGNLLVAADVMWKNWEEADFWGDVYEDQMVYSIGAQMKMGNWRFRAGYGYADDPTDRDAQGVKGLPYVCSSATRCNVIPVGSGNDSILHLGQSVLEYLQASQTEVIYRHRATLGVGYMGFLAPFLNIDGHVGVQFKERNHYSAGPVQTAGVVSANGVDLGPFDGSATTTAADVWSWHAGFALTWNFQY
ncbi:MAG: hypothetical protein OXG06_03175 [Gammaproteobacteria bacterium]|nr:hypothetical protein [Gammaproteobacteria bacterium]